MSDIYKSQSAKPVLAVVPRVDQAKECLFREFEPGDFFPGHGYVTFTLVCIAVDEVDYDTVAYYDCVLPSADSNYSPTVMNFRYRIEDGVFHREHLHTVRATFQVAKASPRKIRF
jgi:hypothetical protein